MKKLFLVAAFLLLVSFLIPTKTFAQSCSCGPNTVGTCTMVTSDNCGTGYRAFCDPGNGACMPNSCKCVVSGNNCTQIPDSCTKADPNSSCYCDYRGCTCRTSITNPRPQCIPACSAGQSCICSGSSCSCGIPTSTTTSSLTGTESLCQGGGISTAIGCIPFDSPANFITFILKWAVGVGGGVAFLLIIVAGFQIMTSSGNPDRLQAGKELLGAAIGGLILLIFSVFILKVIGVDILQIPGLT